VVLLIFSIALWKNANSAVVAGFFHGRDSNTGSESGPDFHRSAPRDRRERAMNAGPLALSSLRRLPSSPVK
jgi:hypothetical protein